MLSKLLAGGVGGFICAMFAFMNVAIMTESSQLRLFGFLGCWITAVAIGLRSPSAPKAWENLLFCTALLLFLLPMLGGISMALQFWENAAAGSGIFYFALVGALLIMISGGILWAVGSFLGRDRRL